MTAGLPLEILPLLSPILHWVEGGASPGLPSAWKDPNIKTRQELPEWSWLQRELPSSSMETYGGIFAASRETQQAPSLNLRSHRGRVLDPPADYSLVEALERLSQHFFCWVGNELCVLEHKMQDVHALARRFPVPHLIRFAYAKNITRKYLTFEDCLRRPMRLSHLPSNYKSLRTQMEKGLFEGHLHLSSLLGPEEVWVADILAPNFHTRNHLFNSEELRLSFLGRMLVSTLAVILAIEDQPDSKHITKILSKLTQFLTDFDRLYLSEYQNFPVLARRLKDNFSEVCQALNELPTSCWCLDCSWQFSLIHPTYQLPVLLRGPRKGNREKLDRDTLIKRFHLYLMGSLIRAEERQRKTLLGHERLTNNQGSSANENSAKGRKHTGRAQPSRIETLLKQLAFRYFVVHTHHWQQSTQKGKTTGLYHFQKSRRSAQRSLALKDRILMNQALDYSCQFKSQQGLEGRIAPPKSITAVNDWLMSMYDFHKKDMLPQFGIIVHFKKEAVKNSQTRGPFTRFGPVRRNVGSGAKQLFRILSLRHPAVPYIVGIDAAGHELTTPPEVFAPAFRFLRDLPIECSPERYLDRGRYTTSLADQFRTRRLGMTFHVGEDFRHLLSGLRAIDEVIQFLNPQPGDRLGHATALAIDPGKWMAQSGYQAVLTRQSLLDNFVWVRHLLGPGHPLIGALSIEDEIQKYARLIYAESVDGKNQLDCSPATLFDAWRLRQLDPYFINTEKLFENTLEFTPPNSYGRETLRWSDVQHTISRQVKEEIGSKDAFAVLAYYWFNKRVAKKGGGFMNLDMYPDRETWQALIEAVQQKIQKKLVAKQIVIETCPTSNLLIGPIAELADHQIFPLSLNKDHGLRRELRITVNTDNPGVIVTSLEHEFYLIAEVLLREGVSEAKVINWMEWLRQNGKDCSFLNMAPHPKHLASLFESNERRYNKFLGETQKNFWLRWVKSSQKADTERGRLNRLLNNPVIARSVLESAIGKLRNDPNLMASLLLALKKDLT